MLEFENYAEQLQRIRELRARGLGFSAIKRILWTKPPAKRRVLLAGGEKSFFGIEAGALPWLGGVDYIPPDMAEERYVSTLCWLIGQAITPETDAVIEVGAGVGFLSVSLAAAYQDLPVQFIATDLARNGVAACEELSASAGTTNLQAFQLDLMGPDFGFAKRFKAPLFVCSSVLTFDADPVPFLDTVQREIPAFRMCAFEPVSKELPSHLQGYNPIPLTLPPGLDLHPDVSIRSAFLPLIMERVRAGTLKLERLIPEVVGKSPFYPVTLIQFGAR